MRSRSSNSGPYEAFADLRLTVRERTYRGSKAVYVDVERTFRVDLAMDTLAVMRELGAKAASNRSRRSRALGGLIQVTVRPDGS